MHVLPWLDPQRAERLQRGLRERILVMDGAMGTMIQQHGLEESDYRGTRFSEGFDRHRETAPDHAHGPGCGCARDQRGNNDLLTLTRPDIVQAIHADYLTAGADLIETNTFNSTAVSLADYGLQHLARELNETGARLARSACDAAEAATPGQPRFVIGVLGNSRAGLYWYTYPPEGSAARQSWIVGTGRVLSDRIEFDAVTATGPSFGPGYDVSRLVLAPWGRIVIRFTDCNNARLSFAGPAGYGSGTRTLLRLTGVDGHTCDGRALRRYDEGVGRGASGSYFEPASAGQGFSVHALPGGGMAMSFYTFEPDGTPLWLVGAGGYDGRRAIFDDLVRAEGTPFTPFNGLGVRRSSWGGAVVEFLDCDRARATFTGVTPYGTDVLDAVRLGAIDGVPCPDAPPE